MLHIYGIKNCDTVKKALKFFEAQGTEYTFHDFKKENPAEEKLMQWLETIGANTLINKRGTTYRKLDETSKTQIETRENLIPILQENTSLIKRPVIEQGNNITVGFTADIQEKYLKP